MSLRWMVAPLNDIQKTRGRGDFRGNMKLSDLEWFHLGCLWSFEVDTCPFFENTCNWSSEEMSELQIELWQLLLQIMICDSVHEFELALTNIFCSSYLVEVMFHPCHGIYPLPLWFGVENEVNIKQ